MHAKLLRFCPTLCDAMDYSLLSTSIHGIFQARILEWVAMPSLQGGLPDPGIEPASLMSPAFAGRFLTTSATWETQVINKCLENKLLDCNLHNKKHKI